MSNTIYLYLKTHNKTGLKYLGKTVQDPFVYRGSGKRWNNHLNKHGDDVSTEILFETQDKEEFKRMAIEYSKKWNIVESKEFANLVMERGDGGDTSAYIDYDKIDSKENGRKIRRTKQSAEWKETVGKEARRKQVENTDYEMVRKKQVENTDYEAVGKKISKTKSSEEWKEAVGKEARRKQVENTDYEAVGKKISKTKSSEEWKATKGKEASKNISAAAKKRDQVKCPYCDKQGQKWIMTRWHFDNCKGKTL